MRCKRFTLKLSDNVNSPNCYTDFATFMKHQTKMNPKLLKKNSAPGSQLHRHAAAAAVVSLTTPETACSFLSIGSSQKPSR